MHTPEVTIRQKETKDECVIKTHSYTSLIFTMNDKTFFFKMRQG